MTNGLFCYTSCGLSDVIADMSRMGHQWPAASGKRMLPHERPLPALAAPRMLGPDPDHRVEFLASLQQANPIRSDRRLA